MGDHLLHSIARINSSHDTDISQTQIRQHLLLFHQLNCPGNCSQFCIFCLLSSQQLLQSPSSTNKQEIKSPDYRLQIQSIQRHVFPSASLHCIYSPHAHGLLSRVRRRFHVIAFQFLDFRPLTCSSMLQLPLESVCPAAGCARYQGYVFSSTKRDSSMLLIKTPFSYSCPRKSPRYQA